MTESDDLALLRAYARENSEPAFQELVTRHVNLVYSAALRQTREPQLAEEVTQAVFILLAQKAGKISDRTILTGWLFNTTRFTALSQVRTAARRSRQMTALEKELQMQTELPPEATNEIWSQISPWLDDALTALGEKDRQVVLLRFFENKTLSEVGQLTGMGEDTARKRISRALKKLHHYFKRRGISSTTAIISGAISTNSIHAVPLGLANAVSTIAIAKGATASASTLTLIKGALKIMAWSKAKIAIITATIILLGASTATVAMKELQKSRIYSWQLLRNFNPPWSFDELPQQVKIIPTAAKFQTHTAGPWARETVYPDSRFIGIAQPIQTIIECAFYVRYPNRVIYSVELPTNRYDFIATLPHNSGQAMQQEIKKRFGLIGKYETLTTNVLLLEVKSPNAVILKPSISKTASTSIGNGIISVTQGNMNGFAYSIENYFKIPIIDKTGLTNDFDFQISWDDYKGGHPNLNEFKQALPDQLGLELVSTNMPIEMLVVEKVK